MLEIRKLSILITISDIYLWWKVWNCLNLNKILFEEAPSEQSDKIVYRKKIALLSDRIITDAEDITTTSILTLSP